MRLAHEGAEVAEGAVVGMDLGERRDVVAVVAQRRWVERQEPHGRDAEVGDVVELLGQPGEVAHPVSRPVVERLDVELVDDRVLVPVRIVAQELRRAGCGSARGAAGCHRPQGLLTVGLVGWPGQPVEGGSRGATVKMRNASPAGSRTTARSAPALARHGTGEQVGEQVRLVPPDADGRQVRVEDRTLGGGRVAVHRHVDGVAPAVGLAGERVDLAVRHRLAIEEGPLAAHVLEAQVVIPLQGGALVSQPVELADEQLDVALRVPVASADLVLLRVEVLLALAETRRLAQLPAGVDAVRARQRRRQHGANDEGRPPMVEVVRVDVGRVREQVAAEVLDHLGLGQLGQVVAQLGGRLAPGEVGVALGEADLGQLPHHLRLRERLRQEDDVGVVALDLGDQPRPERDRLGVRIVDAEDPDAALDPDGEDSPPLVPERHPRGRRRRR